MAFSYRENESYVFRETMRNSFSFACGFDIMYKTFVAFREDNYKLAYRKTKNTMKQQQKNSSSATQSRNKIIIMEMA